MTVVRTAPARPRPSAIGLVLQASGEAVLLGLADATAQRLADQLNLVERAGVDIIAQRWAQTLQPVAFDLEAAVARNSEVVIIDTAGACTTSAAMEELTKIRRVMDRIVPGAPRGAAGTRRSTGQNAVEQAKQFTSAADVAGWSSQSGRNGQRRRCPGDFGQLSIPVRFIGMGNGGLAGL